MSLLAARGLSRTYRATTLGRSATPTAALDGVSLDIAAGETVALLGRSGSGKSTLARILVGLEKPDAGDVLFKGRPIAGLKRGERRAMRRSVQMVFQDSIGAVDPRSTVGAAIGEPLRHLRGLDAAARREATVDLLRMVGLEPGDAAKLPAQMSGGQLQRVCIARALAPRPDLIVLDEAVSNLDLHLQIQTLDLFDRLRRETGVAYLFVTHDLRLVERFCERVIVIDAGRVCEEAPVTRPLALSSAPGRALHAAVLPAMPRRSSRNASPAPATSPAPAS